MAIESKFRMTKPVFNFTKEKILLYGDPKIGKTQLCAHLSDKIGFVAAEKGHGKISALVAPVSTWTDFTSTMEVIKNEPVDMIVIDTITALWYIWIEHFLTENSIKHEGDIGYGVGYARLVREFAMPINALQRCGKGVILIAHTKESDENGTVVMRPNLPTDKNNQIRDSITAMVDSIWYMRYRAIPEDGKTVKVREIRTKGDALYVAGSRFSMEDPIKLVNDDPRASGQIILEAYKRAADAVTESAKPIQKELLK